MKPRVTLVVVAIAGGLALAGVMGVASAGSDANLPEGPFIDFCPTAEQIEAHLAQYGFDYKPTVTCGEEGIQLPAGDPVSPMSDAEVEAHDRAVLEGAKRAPDTDGDPASMEVVLQDGSTAVIFIQTDNPEQFKGMTPAEFVKAVYGDK